MLQSMTGHLLLTYLAVCKQIRRFKDCMCAKADHATERIIAYGLHIIDATNANIAFIAMLWHLSVLAICTQSRHPKDCICALADHATERISAHAARIIDAMDVIICAEPSPCNGVCRIMEQAAHAAQERWVSLCVSWAMLHSVRFLFSMLVNEPETFASTVVLMFFFGLVAMLQSRLTTAAGAWQQYEAAVIDLRTPQPTSACTTTTAELYYLRHCRSCAAAASGNKGGSHGQSNPLVMSGTFFLGVMLQRMCTMLLSKIQPVFRLTQHSWRVGRHATKSLLKLTIVFLAMLQSALENAHEMTSAWLSPLELVACLHLTTIGIHMHHPGVQCQPDHTGCSALTLPSLQEMATTAIALFSLMLALLDWHVPPITCRILTAMCMHAIQQDSACTVMALLLPTFGKRPQEERGAPKKRATTAGHATERTSESAMPPAVPMPPCNAPDDALEPAAPSQLAEQPRSTGATGGVTEEIAAEMEASMTLDDVVTELSLHHSQDAQAIANAARTILEGKQTEIRSICKSWGVQRKGNNAAGNYGNRPVATLKQELKTVLIKRTMELKRKSVSARHDVREAGSSNSDATERTAPEFALEGAVADALQHIRATTQNLPIMARVVDHACNSQACISHRIATMCQGANWKTTADLCSDQPVDACGYIAADTVCRLRETALADADSWHHLQLPDYSQLHCIDQGNKVLRKSSADRILDTDEVNRLVRHYSHLDQRPRAAEEWWGGAIAIDHFIAGLPGMVQELTATNPGTQHRWRAWIVNTQTSEQRGSHWFTVVLGTRAQLLQSIAAHGASDSSSSHLAADPAASSSASSPTETAPSTRSYPNLFEAPDAAITDMINWAHANMRFQPVAAWLEACSQWDSAVATKEHHQQKKRRKLCNDHNIPCTRAVDSNNNPDAAVDHVRQQLRHRIQQIRATRKTFGALGMLQSDPSSTQQQAGKASESQSKAEQKNLSQYFRRATGPAASADSAAAPIPAIATDVGSTFLRLRAKQHRYVEDSEFDIVVKALGLLRNRISQDDLLKISIDKRGKPKTIRQQFKDRDFGTIRFATVQPSTDASSAQQSGDGCTRFHHTHDWRTYYIKLLVLAQARRWLSATERLDAIEESPPTPKTIFQLAAAIRQHSISEYLPFGSDFEDIDAYSPTISRLLAYAEIHDGCTHSHGTFSTPRQTLPYTYRELQDCILERRRRQAGDATERAPQQLVTSAEDLANRLRAFASDAIVVKHIIEFALPSKKRANATEITPKAASTLAAPTNSIKNRGAATEHTVCMEETQDAEDDAPQPQIEHTTADDDSTPAATDITAHSTSAATEHATRQKRRLKKHDDSHQTDSFDVTLSQPVAKAMADEFFKFIQQEGLQRTIAQHSTALAQHSIA